MNPSPSSKAPEPDRISLARQKRAERRLSELNQDKRTALIDGLAQTLGLGIRPIGAALLSGLLFAGGFRYREPVLIIFAALVAPWMGSVTGLALAAILGEARYWFRFLATIVLILLLTGIGAGVVGSFGELPDDVAGQTLEFARLNLLEFLFVIGGAAIAMLILARDSKINRLAQVAIAYGILRPLSAFVLGILWTEQDLWLAALSTFLLHLSWAVAIGLVVLVVLGYRPQRRGARTFLVGFLLIGVVGLSGSLSLGGSILLASPAPTPLPILTPTFTGTPVPATLTAILPSATPSPRPSATPSPTPTATPTQTLAVVLGTGGFGVMLRDAPNGNPLRGLFDGVEVEIIGGPLRIEDETWWHVRTSEGEEGWVLSNFIATVTPEGTESP